MYWSLVTLKSRIADFPKDQMGLPLTTASLRTNTTEMVLEKPQQYSFWCFHFQPETGTDVEVTNGRSDCTVKHDLILLFIV